MSQSASPKPNLTLSAIAKGQASKERSKRLEEALRALLSALDTQHFDGKPPGRYHYSGNVMDAMRFARSLVKTPVEEIEVPEADKGRSCA